MAGHVYLQMAEAQLIYSEMDGKEEKNNQVESLLRA